MNVVCIVPARLDSRRLPAKQLRNILDRNLLSILIERVSAASVDECVVATTNRTVDDPLIKWCIKNGVSYFRHLALDDVLSRFHACAVAFNADLIVKANGDSPLLSPEVIDMAITQLNEQKIGLVTGKMKYSGLPIGLGAEVMTMEILNFLNEHVQTQQERNAITTWAYSNTSPILWQRLLVPQNWQAPEIDTTVDTPEDLNHFAEFAGNQTDQTSSNWKIENIIEHYGKERI